MKTSRLALVATVFLSLVVGCGDSADADLRMIDADPGATEQSAQTAQSQA